MRVGATLVLVAALAGVGGVVPLPTTRLVIASVAVLTVALAAGRLLRRPAPAARRIVVVGGTEELATELIVRQTTGPAPSTPPQTIHSRRTVRR